MRPGLNLETLLDVLCEELRNKSKHLYDSEDITNIYMLYGYGIDNFKSNICSYSNSPNVPLPGPLGREKKSIRMDLHMYSSRPPDPKSPLRFGSVFVLELCKIDKIN